MANIPFLNNAYFAAKVGIGVQSPTTPLDVSGIIKTTTSFVGNAVVINQVTAATSSGRIIFKNNSGSDKMAMEDNGNFGIGTISPGEKLEVNGNIKVIESGQTPDVSVFHSDGSYAKLRGQGLFLSRSTSYVAPVADNFGSLAVGYNGARWGNVEINAATVKFENGANEFMRISSSGKVGIGTTNPVEKLQINSGDVLINNSTISSLKSGGSLYIDLNTFGSYSGRNFRISDNGTSLVNVTQVGNVGIGMTSPSEKLDVLGNIKLRGTNNLTIGSTSDGGNFSLSSGIRGFNFANNNGDLVRIDGDGNVGIGNTSPGSTLPNLFNSTTPKVLQISSATGSTDSGILIRRSDNATGIDIWNDSSNGVSYIDNRYGSSTGDIYFRVQTNGTPKTVMTITGDEKIGIGTTSPETKLHLLTNTTDATQQLLIQNGHSGDAAIKFNISGDTYSLGIDNSDSDKFKLSAGNLGTNDRLVIDASGNVGIGDTAPSHKLTVPSGTNGRIARLGNLEITSQAATYTGSSIEVTGSNSFIKYNSTLGHKFFTRVSGGGNTLEALTIVPDTGNVGIGTTSPGAKLDVAGTGNFTGLVSGITPVAAANFATKSYVDAHGGGTGPFLPLAGGTMTGNTTHGDNVKSLYGAGGDLEIFHDGSNSYIENYTGDFIFTQALDDGDMIFKSDNGSGGTTPYLTLDGGITSLMVYKDMLFVNDGNGGKLKFGASQDLQMYHNGADSYIENYTGNLTFRQRQADGDILFECDDGGGGTIQYFRVDGGAVKTIVSKNFAFIDGVKVEFGDSGDFQIYHDGSHSYIQDTSGTGDLRIDTNVFRLRSANGGESMITAFEDSAVNLMYNNFTKLSTYTANVGTATTTGGTLIDGWKTTTQANAINDTTIATTAYVNNKIALIPAGLVFQGTWNAATNTPTLTSGSGTTGHFYIVSTDGSTNLDGITDWKVGDWAVFVEQGASDQWEKVDNSSVLDGSGTGQKVSMWSGSGTSNTLTDAPITVSGNNATFAGDIRLPNGGKLYTWTGHDLNYLKYDIWRASASGGMTIENISSEGEIYLKSGNALALTLDDSQNATFAGDINIGTGKSIYFSSTTGLRLVHDGSNGNVINSTGDLKITNGATDRDIIFRIKDGVNSLEAMRIDGSSSQVGIGTTFPQSKLQVAGGIQMADDTATASAAKVGTMRYRTGTEYVEVTGAEILTNPGFDTDTTWVKGTGWTIANGKASVDNASSTALSQPSFGVTTGKIYNVRIDVSNYTSGSLQPQFGASQVVASITANGEYNYTVTSTVTGGIFYLYGVGDCEFSVDNASVIEVEAESASYADMCMQTGSSTYEWVNIVRNTY